MLKLFKQMDYWKNVQGVEGFLAAIEKLGTTWNQLNEDRQGYDAPDSIWGQLAQMTEMKNKNTLNARKWLYHTWKRNGKKVFKTFPGNKALAQFPVHSNPTSNHLESSKVQVSHHFRI
jgi:hypothetical protein